MTRKKAWLDRVGARPAVLRGLEAGQDYASPPVDLSKDEEARKILFGNKPKRKS
jgi:hypothetical protein